MKNLEDIWTMTAFSCKKSKKTMRSSFSFEKALNLMCPRAFLMSLCYGFVNGLSVSCFEAYAEILYLPSTPILNCFSNLTVASSD